jgi:imidazoleglycerol-phosphate dehydratase
MARVATIHRKTAETDIRLRINLDGRGESRIATGVRFFDHMLDLVARHGAFDLSIEAKGDLDVDQHHTVEDVGITLGEAVAKALGSKKGILRAGYFLMPMDETLAAAAVDLSGRPYCIVNAKIKAARVGDFQVELLEDFFSGFVSAARANVHLRCLYGRSSHHQVEAIFKAFARALRFAVARDKRMKNVLPSTKELL